jgi:KUP system potassium uptake protein
VAATGFFLIIDIALFSSTTLKIPSGGWFPLILGLAMVTIMLTWRTGRSLVASNLKRNAIEIGDFLQSLFLDPPPRVAGTAIFFRPAGDGVPQAMLHNLRHNKVLHERTVFLTVIDADIPAIPESQRIKVEVLGHACYQVNVYYGFKDERDIPLALESCKAYGLEFEPMETSFFIGRQNVIPVVGVGMALWRESLFATMSRMSRDAADYFRVPPNRVIELGVQVEI